MQVIALMAVMAVISIVTKPSSLTTKEPTVYQVWYYGWLAALSTGLGALPLLFMSKPDNLWMSVSNAIAAGMMLSASYSLVTEGVSLDPDGLAVFGVPMSHTIRVILGVLSGILFVVSTKSYVERHEDLTLGENLTGMEAAKVLLIISVMTLHSFAEGLGIGVSFCGKDGAHLGAFISASLAVHNVPEGLAVALVLVPRGVSKFKTFAWSVCTSLPQPLIAVPVYLFVEHFIAWQSAGLGFAAGAMLWVACFELIADAIREISLPLTSFSLSLSFVGMLAISAWIDVVTGHDTHTHGH
jgi:ZIP family zinc transporter